MRDSGLIGNPLGAVLAAAVSVAVLFGPAAGQEPAPVEVAQEAQEGQEAQAGEALRVFLDCQSRYCDFDFFRREIPFVNYTRDRQDAQVHLLITSEMTGGGGRRFVLDFFGREEFEGLDDQLLLSTRANLADEQVLTELSRTIKAGLIRYVARTPFADRVQILFEEPVGEAAVATPETDPWNFWVFRLRGNASLGGEERSDFVSISGGASASRITEDLKVQLSVSSRYSESNFETSDTTTVTSIRRNHDASGRIAWSVGEHWAVGMEGSLTHSTFSNEDLTTRFAPGIEYNIFPYAFSNRRLLTLRYSLGFNYYNWIEETVFLETEEFRADSRLAISMDVNQPWGEAGAAAEASVLLDDLAKNRFILFGNLEVRLFRGLSLDIFGSVSRIRDQINLPAGDATEEEILLRQRELETGFTYDFSIGFSYTFGSIFSNVVNPRFGGSGFRFIRRF